MTLRDRAAEKRRFVENLVADGFAVGPEDCRCLLCLDWPKHVQSALDAYAALVGQEKDEEIARLQKENYALHNPANPEGKRESSLSMQDIHELMED